jgi:hypothetical protein
MASEFGDLNSVGEVRTVGRMGSIGGNDGRGPIDNVLPTGIVSRGDEPKAADVMDRGIRAGMSTSKNMPKKRMASR